MDKLVSKFLSILERREEPLLAWCIVDGGFSYDELYEHASAFISTTEAMVSPEQLLSEMQARKLLFEFPCGGRSIYRTRMAETVRLLSTLRQWFPNSDWRTAPNLVADYRLALSPRQYPDRNILKKDFLERLAATVPVSTNAITALDALIGVPTLSDFQLAAAGRLFLDIAEKASRGMIICAGTGTGKTFAYYLPALASVATIVERNLYWTKLIAVYPRIELLKDQISEVFRLTRSLEGSMVKSQRRKLRIGCFYVDTPKNVGAIAKDWKVTRDGRGFVCPYLRCPKCGESMIWPRTSQMDETLECESRECGTQVSSEEFAVTREAMRQHPPDVLFATTEMLNRNISDSRYGSVFGVGGVSPPRFMLLDEVHTYAGTSGAQVALLLRRWRHASGARAQFTGLSATLREAPKFFSTLTGIPESRVEEIVPGIPLVEEGMAYQIALRGDPVSQTALLSTTIQTAMLMRRILDPGPRTAINPSRGLYGSRVFAFTDNLDVTNRLYHSLLDAEKPRFSPGHQPLAALRSGLRPQEKERFRNGQSWRMCEEIGHGRGLTASLHVTRTSSQDPGVDFAADVIVATPSLEVGYNDEEAGAVLQHKAPRDLAGFLQRKGRAGRPRVMRPWTVVISPITGAIGRRIRRTMFCLIRNCSRAACR